MTAAAIDAPGRRTGKIGPNAITRVIAALETVESPRSVRRIFQAAGLEAYLRQPPTDMVDAQEVARLHQALHGALGDGLACMVGRIAGELTGDYLLGHRIPRPVQAALRCCPAGVASRLLATAIETNAWTFVGGGGFSARHGRPTIFTIRDCPICLGQRSARPYCDFYAATFERLYSRLVDKGARVTETSCLAMGAPACAFTIVW